MKSSAFINSMFELLFFFRIFILFLSIVTNNTYLHNVLQIELQNPCRQGKKLLVLDIDYTLFDHRSTAENPLQLMRPCNFISPLFVFFFFHSIRGWSLLKITKMPFLITQVAEPWQL